MSKINDVAENSEELDSGSPIRKRMKLPTIALGKRLVENGNYKHGSLTLR